MAQAKEVATTFLAGILTIAKVEIAVLFGMINIWFRMRIPPIQLIFVFLFAALCEATPVGAQQSNMSREDVPALAPDAVVLAQPKWLYENGFLLGPQKIISEDAPVKATGNQTWVIPLAENGLGSAGIDYDGLTGAMVGSLDAFGERNTRPTWQKSLAWDMFQTDDIIRVQGFLDNYEFVQPQFQRDSDIVLSPPASFTQGVENPYLQYLSTSDRPETWISDDNREIANELVRSLYAETPAAAPGSYEVRPVIERLEDDATLRATFAPVLPTATDFTSLSERVFLSDTGTGAVQITNRGGRAEFIDRNLPEMFENNREAILELGIELKTNQSALGVEVASLDLSGTETFLNSAPAAMPIEIPDELLAMNNDFMAGVREVYCQFTRLASLGGETLPDDVGGCREIEAGGQCEFRGVVRESARNLQNTALKIIRSRLAILDENNNLGPLTLSKEYFDICVHVLSEYANLANGARNWFEFERDVPGACNAEYGLRADEKGAYRSPIPREFFAHHYKRQIELVNSTVQFESQLAERRECSAGYLGGGLFMTAAHCMPAGVTEERFTISADLVEIKEAKLRICGASGDPDCTAIGAAFDTFIETYSHAEILIKGIREPETREFADFAIFRIAGESSSETEALGSAADEIFEALDIQRGDQVDPTRVSFVFSTLISTLGQRKLHAPHIKEGVPFVYDGGMIRYHSEISLEALPERVLDVCVDARLEDKVGRTHIENRMAALANAYRPVNSGGPRTFRFSAECSDLGRRVGLCEHGDFMKALGGELDVPRGASGAPVFMRPDVALGQGSEIIVVGIVSKGETGRNISPAIGRHEVFVPVSSVVSYLRNHRDSDPNAAAILAVIERQQ
ncbi:hypothetical protein [Pseudosulfitobacter koreensis]|uniref:Trypsin-like peptidase domain-containing protein n=1 Tax=Pseudosulfitobacter koreensis TaxID=2968472 RepID=A0ABT1Z1F5_9RHOB|nr:hypothetical protein [Pseudosulfitobacter koreense]MCR8826964.1 hypothetical protein [Pseudosulfitobacter koreense]